MVTHLELEQTAIQEWVRERINNVRMKYTAFECLTENGHGEMLSDSETAVSIFCPFHANKNTPAARYYPSVGSRHDSLHCFVCKQSWCSINLNSKFKGLRFMDSLSSLEHRLNIKLPKRPESNTAIVDPIQRTSGYVSDRWNDIPSLLSILEKKLLRIRDKSSIIDYVKFCRVMDAVSYDYEKLGSSNSDMVNILIRVMNMMNDIQSLDLSGINSQDVV